MKKLLLLAILLLTSVSTLRATNYFNWNVETTTFVIQGGNVTPQYSGGAARSTTTAHSGSWSMYCPVPSAQNGNAPVGVSAPNTNLDVNYGFNLVGGPSIYYRFWMKIMPGFSWAGGSQKVKSSRIAVNGNVFTGYTGYLLRSGFNLSECGGAGCDPNSGGDSTATVSYNMDTMADGAWHEYIIRVKGNSTTSAYNAELQVWIDGSSVGLVDATHGRAFRLNTSTGPLLEKWATWMLAPYWQAGGGGTMYLDDFSTDDVYNSIFASQPDTTAPSDPGGLTAQAAGSNSITLSWTASTDNVGVSAYRVERCTGTSCSNFAQIGTSASNSYNDSSVAALTGYTYRVKAQDAAGNVSVNYSNTATATTPAVTATECTPTWQADHPSWIWCDDFEADRLSQYFDPTSGFTRQSGVGYNNTWGMLASWTIGQVDSGSLKLAFGLTPSGFTHPAGVSTTAIYRDIYYRAYIKSSSNWVGQGSGHNSKFARAHVFTAANWTQAMIAHLWSNDTNNNNDYLLLDPASCVTGSTVTCVGYNDFAHLQFLGGAIGTQAIFAAPMTGNWQCIEAHVKLNDAGSSNGIEEFWVDGTLNATRTNLNFVGSYTTYGINSIFFENYINGGASVAQQRWWDNIVVATQRIGCSNSPPVTLPAVPTGLRKVN